MISESSKYYGAVLIRLIHQINGHIKIDCLSSRLPGFYLLNEKIPMYIKYATQRRGPWGFTFQKKHQDLCKELFQAHEQCIIVFVCGCDGIVALEFNDLQKILVNNTESQGAVSIHRRLKKMYQIKGRDGELERKISRNSLESLFQRLTTRREIIK